ncbi:MAG: hypothetical protein QXY70_02735, partial [Nanopusillaceae archaeon]
GESHTCALLSNGSVACWGYNYYGQLGDGTNTNRATPVNVVGIDNAVAIAAGWGHTCALLSNGTVRCWGRNNYGQLGDGTNTNRATPVNVVNYNFGGRLEKTGGILTIQRPQYFFDTYFVRAYSEIEPTVSLRNEEIGKGLIIIIDSPRNLTYYENFVEVNITTDCNECENISYSVKVLINNKEVYSADNVSGKYYILFSYLLPHSGTYNLTVIANSTELNLIKTSSVIFTYIEPTTTIQIISPQNLTYTSLPINASIQVNSTIPHNVYVYLDNNLIFQQSYNASNNTINIPLNINQEKTYNLTVLVNSSVITNHIAQSSVIFTLKPTTTINIISPQNLTYTSLPINASIQVNSTIPHNVYVYLDGSLIFSQSYNASNNTINLPLNLFQEKTYNLTVLVNSSVITNHIAQSSVIFTLKPITTIQILSPQNTTYISLPVNALIQINSTIPHNVYVYLDNNLIFQQSYNASNKTINLPLNLTQEKTYNLTVLVNSSVITNHIAQSSVIFTLKPITTIQILSPQNTTYIS